MLGTRFYNIAEFYMQPIMKWVSVLQSAEPHTIIIVAKRYSDIANTSYLFSYLIEAQIIVPLYYILPLV